MASPYFLTDDGEPWTPIGQNDAICWDEFAGLFRRRDLASVEAHLIWLRDHGVTCLRLMLEYAQVRHRYIERPVGRFVPGMIQLWDDLFALCERVGMRILLTPFDTFWTWLHWRHHPYSSKNGGPLDHPARMLLDSGTPRCHQGASVVCGRALGRQRRAVCVGPLERNSSGAGRRQRG